MIDKASGRVQSVVLVVKGFLGLRHSNTGLPWRSLGIAASCTPMSMLGMKPHDDVRGITDLQVGVCAILCATAVGLMNTATTAGCCSLMRCSSARVVLRWPKASEPLRYSSDDVNRRPRLKIVHPSTP